MGAVVEWATEGKTGSRAPPWHEVRTSITGRRLFTSRRLGTEESCHLVSKGGGGGQARDCICSRS